MTRFVLVLGMLVWSWSAFAGELLKIVPNKTSYNVGESAILRIYAVTPPQGPGYEFFLAGKWDGQDVSVSRVTASEFYYTKNSLTTGSHQFQVRAYIQDKALAKAFNSAIAHYDQEISRLNDELLDAESPEEIAEIEEEIDLNLARKAGVVSQLNSIRRQVDGPTSIQIQVN